MVYIIIILLELVRLYSLTITKIIQKLQPQWQQTKSSTERPKLVRYRKIVLQGYRIFLPTYCREPVECHTVSTWQARCKAVCI